MNHYILPLKPTLHYMLINSFILLLLFLKIFTYLFMRDTEREAETQAEREAGSMQGAGRGTPSRVSRSMPWAKGGAKTLSHPGVPYNMSLFFFQRFYLFIHKRHRERCRETGRGGSRLPAGWLMQDLIPPPWDLDLSQRERLLSQVLKDERKQSIFKCLYLSSFFHS